MDHLLQKFLFFLQGFCLLALVQNAQAQVVDGNRIMDQPMGENLCALTFDDGPSRNTAELLDMLADYKIPATFFLLGTQARVFPEIVVRMLNEGHEVGNHSWSHPNLKKLSPEAQAMQIIETDRLLRSLGAAPFFIRPPYGAYDDNTVRIAEELGLSVMLWSMDSRDWKRLPDDYTKLLSTRGTIYDDGQLKGIFLFHDTHKTTVDDLPRIIAHLKAGGCDRFVTVSEYLLEMSDPEAGMLMTRHSEKIKVAEKSAKSFELKYGAGSGPIRMARCSEPWHGSNTAVGVAPVPLDEAHAAASGQTDLLKPGL